MLDRRRFLKFSALSQLGLYAPQLFAETIYSQQMIEGPLYPDKLPLDTDNDLLIINERITPAVGEITHLSGQVLSKSGLPVRNAFVEIWQTDSHGNYIHSNGKLSKTDRDTNFQGYGRFLTDSHGRYYFRTIKPVPYSQRSIYRTPHIHVAISKQGKRIFTTQLLINGHPDNADDILFRRIQDPLAQETLLVDFKQIPGSPLKELAATFDIRLGVTVEEMDDGSLWGLSKPLGMTNGLDAPAWEE